MNLSCISTQFNLAISQKKGCFLNFWCRVVICSFKGEKLSEFRGQLLAILGEQISSFKKQFSWFRRVYVLAILREQNIVVSHWENTVNNCVVCIKFNFCTGQSVNVYKEWFVAGLTAYILVTDQSVV